jgi:ubiquinone/menaquinone biosynthesis C-methylase UbiE
MGFHTYDPERAPNLEDESRYRYLSREELVALLDPGPRWTIADLGSGTGFYTDDVAPFVEQCYAVDLEPEMHDFYRDKGVPENVELVTAEIGDLPFDDGELDGAFSTMTFHEFATEDALDELARVLASGAPVAMGDWTRNGSGESGPPTDERYDLATAEAMLEDAGFSVERANERPETFVVRAVA